MSIQQGNGPGDFCPMACVPLCAWFSWLNLVGYASLQLLPDVGDNACAQRQQAQRDGQGRSAFPIPRHPSPNLTVACLVSCLSELREPPLKEELDTYVEFLCRRDFPKTLWVRVIGQSWIEQLFTSMLFPQLELLI
jgi:hypothetical protein